MPELYNIPLTYREGTYRVIDFSKDIDRDGVISFDYDTQYQMLEYDIPVGKERREMTLYSVPEDEFIRTLRAIYDKGWNTSEDHSCQRAAKHFYTSAMKARRMLRRKFEICYPKCRCHNRADSTMHGCYSKAFIDYYCDGDNMDYHAVVGTAAQMEEVRQKGLYEDSCDYSGNYPSEYMEGDDRMLITMVRCAEGHPSENFRYAIEIMSQHIEKYALEALHKTEDFKFICAEYD